MTEASPDIAWGDLETSGLTAMDNCILEVAFVVTDADLNVLDPGGFHRVIRYSDAEVRAIWQRAHPIVREMHEKTGLWDKLGNGAPIEEVDEDLLQYLQGFGSDSRTMPLGGNSNRLDFNFIDAHLPKTSAFLSYRMRDVSGLAGFVHDWYPDEPWFEKASDHTAMMDITECIREARHYRARLQELAVSEYLNTHLGHPEDDPIEDAAEWAEAAIKS